MSVSPILLRFRKKEKKGSLGQNNDVLTGVGIFKKWKKLEISSKNHINVWQKSHKNDL